MCARSGQAAVPRDAASERPWGHTERAGPPGGSAQRRKAQPEKARVAKCGTMTTALVHPPCRVTCAHAGCDESEEREAQVIAAPSAGAARAGIAGSLRAPQARA